MEQTWLRQIFTMATGLRCTVLACEYNTASQVPDDTDLPIKVQLLQIHADGNHNVGAVGQDCVQYDMVMYVAKYMQKKLDFHCATKHTEYDDAAGPTNSKGQYKSSCCSNQS